MKSGFLAVSALALAVSIPATMIAAQPGEPIRQLFDIAAPFQPMLADQGGNKQLAYELHLTSFFSLPIRIDRIVLVDEAGQAIAIVAGDAVAKTLAIVGGSAAEETPLVNPGRRAVAYFNIALERAAPTTIAHRISYSFMVDGEQRTGQLNLAPMPVESAPLTLLGPPLRGGPWATLYDQSMPRGHRRVIYATNGKTRIPGRFAIDFIKLDSKGRMARGDASRVDQFHGFNADVLAVADGTVVAVRNDFAQDKILKDRPAVTLGEATGNYVAIDIGGGRFAFYEHLNKGVKVSVGQHVAKGQVIGQLGLTGQGSEPHLHFHLASANSPLDAEGLPFAIQGMELVGGYVSIAAVIKGGPWSVARSDSRLPRAWFPVANSVVRFPGK